MITDRRLATLQRRYDALAIDQLRAEVVRLAHENEALRRERDRAQDLADSWFDDVVRLSDELRERGARTCIAQTGEIGVVAGGCA